MDYRSIPALAAYIDRIGATQLNFRRFMVKEYRGNYYFERSFIEIKRDSTISCSNDEHAPTEDEAIAIKAALQGVAFPLYVAAGYGLLRSLRLMIAEQVGCNEDAVVTFESFDRTDDKIIMVQQRLQMPDGKKRYIPWTYWSDGQWRRMEPDCSLPLWKPRHATVKAKIMIHEGAKAAQFVHELCNNPTRAAAKAAHPWADELCEYEHWGMIGGALAPHRTDWKSVREQKALEVVYVCDNDFPGNSALSKVSQHLMYSLKGIYFDSRFPIGFDMADNMPAKLFNDGRWLGPTLRMLMRPATWATRKDLVPGTKKMATNIRHEFVEEWFHSVRPEVFVHKDWPSQIWTAQEFSNKVAPYSDSKDTADLLQKADAHKSGVLKYTPALEPGMYSNSERENFINTHEPTEIKGEIGDPAPWLAFMQHLVPDDFDRMELLRWCATLIARPDIKMMYGVLLISEIQGVGKSTLGEKILAPLMGLRNVSYPGETEIVESAFNGWAAHKRLAVVHEIYAGHSAKAYNKLKSLITDQSIAVNQKYMASYQIDNWLHIFACSNSPRALKLSMDDQRWFLPKIAENLQNTDYWNGLNDWLNNQGGLAIIKHWAGVWLETNAAVRQGAPAPWSTRKTEVIEEAYGPGQQWANEFCMRKLNRVNGHAVVMRDVDLHEAMKSVAYQGRDSQYMESRDTLRKVCKASGFHVGQQQVIVGGKKCRLISNDRAVANTIMREALDALELMNVVQEARTQERM